MEFVAVDEKAVRPGTRFGDADIEGRGAGQGYATTGGSRVRAWPGADLETRFGAARKSLGPCWAAEKEETGRAVFLRSKDKPARSGEVIEFRGEDFADYCGRCPGFQRLFDRPKRVFGIRCVDENERVWIEPVKRQSRTIECALFEIGEILANPDERRLAVGSKTRGEREHETGRGRGIAGAGGSDLMQGASRKAAREQTIELCLAERDARAWRARHRMRRGGSDAGDRNTSDLSAQKAEPPRCTVPMRKGLAKLQKLPGHIS